MKFVTKELVGLLLATSLAFMILTHSRGFARSLDAVGGNLSTVAKTLQGR